MGVDHVNSNDNGKGSDIFNDVPGMINKILKEIEKGIAEIKKYNGVFSHNERADLSSFDTTETKIDTLRVTLAEFNEKRENRTFRAAKGGSGDDLNAGKFSMLSKGTLAHIHRLCLIKTPANTHELGKFKHTDWNAVMYCRSIQKKDHIMDSAFDKKAYDARKKDFETHDKSLLNGFNKWFKEAETLIVKVFEQLADVVEHFHIVKSGIWRKRKPELVSKLTEGSEKLRNLNNGYPNGLGLGKKEKK
jgi:hypothetical protein